MRKLACIAAIAAILTVSLTGCGNPDAARYTEYDGDGVITGRDLIILEPCPTEDSDNCYWDASFNGNGEGISFVTIDGVTYYAEGE